MTIKLKTPVIAGNGPSAFKGTVADLFSLVGTSGITKMSVIDFEDGSLEVQADETEDFLEVDYDIDALEEGKPVRIKRVFVMPAATTVCF